MLLAFLNMGPSEVAILLVLFLLLFGVDKAPQIARSLGQARAEMDRARRQVELAVRTEEERALDAQVASERERDRQVAESGDERQALVRAAGELGVEAGGTDEEIRAAIRRRLEPDR